MSITSRRKPRFPVWDELNDIAQELICAAFYGLICAICVAVAASISAGPIRGVSAFIAVAAGFGTLWSLANYVIASLKR